MPAVIVRNIGTMPYQQAWTYQQGLFESITDAKVKDGSYSGSSYLVIVEHPPVYTLGKSGKVDHLLTHDNKIELVRINRGGDITFHGPGQLVVYPILDLEQFFTDIKKYMRLLEEVIIRLLADFEIEAGRLEGATGVWLDVDKPNARKICAMGVRASRWVTMHGLALNMNTDLSYFDKIIPCGIVGKGVTSMSKELGIQVDEAAVRKCFLKHFAAVFQANLIEQD